VHRRTLLAGLRRARRLTVVAYWLVLIAC
jgi:hypothetical protein